MAHHNFDPNCYYTTLGVNPVALEINSGDTVSTSTADARGMDSTGLEVTEPGNPQTGPFYVRDAEAGDTLAVTFITLMPNRARGWTSSRLAPFVVDAYDAIDQFPEDAGLIDWNVDVNSMTATLSDPPDGLEKLAVPIRPMLGCFGVAPAGGQFISTATSGPYGGNMDYRGFATGATVFLPVSAPGALFSIGDGHAIQGDGEIAGTGIEISFDVTFGVEVMKDREVGWPRGIDDNGIFTVGNFRPLDDALRVATSEMVHWLQEMGLGRRDAHILLGQCVQYEVGNMFDPAYTMVCRIGWDFLNQIGLNVERPVFRS